MTGFTLGGPNGATLGGPNGGTLGVSSGNWVFDGVELPTSTMEEGTHQELTLRFRVQTDRLLSSVRAAKSDQNQVDVLVTDDGGFTAVDRAGGANTFRLEPPERRKPLRRDGDYLATRYEESLVSGDVGEWDVEIDFVRAANRTDDGSISFSEQPNALVGADAGGTLGESSGFTLGGSRGGSLGNTRPGVPADWWGFDTRQGLIATDRVDAEFLGRGDSGVERFELTVRLSFEQSHAFETALSRVDGSRVRNVADASNRVVDETSDDANTITVDSPTPDVVTDGDYVVLEWSTTRLNDAYQEYSVTVARKSA